MPFVRVVQFSQSVSCSSSAIHGSFRSFGSSCSSVAGSVGSVVQSVHAVCNFAVADQHYPRPGIRHASRLLGFFNKDARHLYSVKIFLPSLYIRYARTL